MASAARLRSGTARAVLASLAREGALSLRAFASRAKLPESTVARHVAALARAGLVETRRERVSRAIAPTELGRRALDLVDR